MPQRRPLGGDVSDPWSDDGRCLTWKVSVRASGRARRLLPTRPRPSPPCTPARTCLRGRSGDGRLPPVTPSPPPRGRLGFPAPPRVPARTRLAAPLPPAGAQVSPSICFSRRLLSTGLSYTPHTTPAHVGLFGSRAPSLELERHAEPSWTSAERERVPRSCPPGTPPRAPNTLRRPPSPAFGAVCPSFLPQILRPGPLLSLSRPCCLGSPAFAP